MSDVFIDFLIRAKLHTYAAKGDEASVSPLLVGSRQLEYNEKPFFYRDIYFGTQYFVGQETVYHEELPYWAMSYSGGVESNIDDTEEIQKIYAFLRMALRQVSREYIYRGSEWYADGNYQYENHSEGKMESFYGTELIRKSDQLVFTLHYSGGILR